MAIGQRGNVNEDETRTPEGAEDFEAPITGDDEIKKNKEKPTEDDKNNLQENPLKDDEKNLKENPTHEEIERRRAESK